MKTAMRMGVCGAMAMASVAAVVHAQAAGVAEATNADAAGVASAADLGPNLYWPGGFEKHLFGGIYSANNQAVLSDADNHTPGGSHCWSLTPKGYQHLELLVTGHGKYRMAFNAKTAHPLTMQLKVIDPGDGSVGDDGKPKLGETVYDIPLAAGDAWQPYTLDFQTGKPFPGPTASEILLACYNGNDSPALIDDLTIRRFADAQADAASPAFSATDVLPNGDFENGVAGWTVANPAAVSHRDELDRDGKVLVLGGVDNADAPAHQAAATFPAATLAGKQIRITADVAYLSSDLPVEPWSAVLLVLTEGKTADGKLIEPTPNPFWCTVGLSAPVGQFKTISATFDVPEGVADLTLRVLAQEGVGKNLAAVDNVKVEVAQ